MAKMHPGRTVLARPRPLAVHRSSDQAIKRSGAIPLAGDLFHSEVHSKEWGRCCAEVSLERERCSRAFLSEHSRWEGR